MKSLPVGLLFLLSLAAAGCSGGGGGSSNRKPEPVVLEPHESSTHLPGNVDFEGRASDEEDGLLASASMTWQVLDTDGDVVGAFQGAAGTISLLVAGEYTAVLTAEDSKGKKGTYEQPFRIGNTIARISDPDNEDVVGIATPFDIDARAETIAPGATLSMLTLVVTDLEDDTVVNTFPITVPAGNTTFNTTVTTSVLAGRYRMRVDVTTNLPAETAEDNIRVLSDAPPVVQILSPAPESRVTPGTSIQFTGTASDAGGGELELSWTSSLEGELSNALAFTSSSLDRAKHTVTLTAVDENGLSDTATIDLYVEDPGTPLFVDASGLPSSNVRGLAVKAGSPDSTWAATAAGLPEYDSATVGLLAGHATGYNTNGNGPALSAACISTGECLFGMDGDGVSIRNAANTAWSTFNGTADPVVNAIAESPGASLLFFATDAGLTQTDLARGNVVQHDQGQLNEVFFSVAVDSAGVVWAGSDGAGLFRLALPSTVSVFTQDAGLADDVVRAVAIGPDGDVWAGTDDGLSRYDAGTNSFTRWRDELPDRQVRALVFDGDVLWIGTDDGAARFDTGSGLWTYFDGGDLADTRVNAIVVDGAGAVWFGCGPQDATGGLTRYDGP